MVRDRSIVVKPLTEQAIAAEHVDVLFLTWLAARAVEQLIDDALRPVAVTADEFAVLSMLAARPDGISPTELARWTAAPATTVSSYVKRFERRGHVTRDPDERDRRSYRIRLTPNGAAAQQAARDCFQPVRTEVTDRLAADERSIRSALIRLRQTADQLRDQA